jgi:thiol-disulfide isomerase/thioredoxin
MGLQVVKAVWLLVLLDACVLRTLAQAVAPADTTETASKLSQSKVATDATAAATPAASAPAGMAKPKAATDAAGSEVTYVLELSAAGGEEASEGAVQVFRALGASELDSVALLERVQAEGQAVVMEGAQQALDQVAAAFEELGLQCTVRAKTAEDAANRAAAQQREQQTAERAGKQTEGRAEQQAAAADAPQRGASASASPGGASSGGRAQGTVYSKEYAGTGVDVLDAAGFKSQLAHASAAPALVVFFAPWCGHCVKMVPEVAKAAARLGAAGVRVVAVDCDRAPDVARSLGIKGYPTVKFMARGRAAAYEGPRTALQLAAFAQGRARLELVMKHVDRLLDPIKAALGGILKKK